jgi:hypothetical protein
MYKKDKVGVNICYLLMLLICEELHGGDVVTWVRNTVGQDKMVAGTKPRQKT